MGAVLSHYLITNEEAGYHVACVDEEHYFPGEPFMMPSGLLDYVHACGTVVRREKESLVTRLYDGVPLRLLPLSTCSWCSGCEISRLGKKSMVERLVDLLRA